MNINKFKKVLEQENQVRDTMIKMFEDIQEQKVMVEKSNQMWFEAVDALRSGFMLHDENHLIIKANKAYKKLAKAAKFKDIIGKPYWQVFPKLNAPLSSCSETLHTQKESIEQFILEDGRIFESRIYLFANQESDFSYGIHIFTDITQKMKEEQRIQELNETLELIIKCNDALLRADSKKAVIEGICDEITTSSYEYAALFLKIDNSIKCSYLSFPTSSIDDIYDIDFSDIEYKTCPMTASIESQKAIIINDIQNDPFWSERLMKHKELCPAYPFGMDGSMLCQYFSFKETERVFSIYSKKKGSFDNQKATLFKDLAKDISYGIYFQTIQESLKETTLLQENSLVTIRKSLLGSIQALSKMTELRDPYTAGHQHRVAKLSVAIASELALSPDIIEGLELAATVHDIGKIVVPTEILVKPTRLTPLEFEMIKNHPQAGYDILKEIEFSRPLAKMVLQHHERLDGSGYPNGLKGEEILFEAKIISVADCVEAIATHRPYRPSLGIEFALEEIEKYKGIWYEESVVDACVRLFYEQGYVL